MDNCNKWQKRKLQKLAQRMYRICFQFTRRYFQVYLFFTQKIAKFYRAKFGQTCFETNYKLRVKGLADVSSAGCHGNSLYQLCF